MSSKPKIKRKIMLWKAIELIENADAIIVEGSVVLFPAIKDGSLFMELRWIDESYNDRQLIFWESDNELVPITEDGNLIFKEEGEDFVEITILSKIDAESLIEGK